MLELEIHKEGEGTRQAQLAGIGNSDAERAKAAPLAMATVCAGRKVKILQRSVAQHGTDDASAGEGLALAEGPRL